MNNIHAICARVALVAVAAAVSGCASAPIATEPVASNPVPAERILPDLIAAGTLAVGSLFSAVGDVAIVTGRTLTNVAGLGTEAAPPRAAAPIQPSLPK